MPLVGSIGTTIYGTADPTSGIGNDDDIYVQTNEAAVVVVWKKESGVWNAIGDVNSPWVTYSPAYAAETGTIGTIVTFAAKYKKVGSFAFVKVYFRITDAGTGSGALLISLPVNGVAASAGVGAITSSTAVTSGLAVGSFVTEMLVNKSDGTTCIATYTTEDLMVSLTYETVV